MVGSEVLLFVATVIPNGPFGRLVVNVSEESADCEHEFISLSVSHPVPDSNTTVCVDWLCIVKQKKQDFDISLNYNKNIHIYYTILYYTDNTRVLHAHSKSSIHQLLHTQPQAREARVVDFSPDRNTYISNVSKIIKNNNDRVVLVQELYLYSFS